MSYALNRIPSNAAAAAAARSPFGRTPVTRGWAEPSDSVAVAGRVLDDVLDSCGSGLDTMRAGARVTILRDDRFDAAVRLYRDGHWELAFDSLAALADQDHAPAAKLALLMLRYGRALYGASFPARPLQIARWAQRVLRAGSRATASPSSITASV
jgi:hypothetical protein